MKLTDGDGIQTIALFQSAGDIADHIAAHAAQKAGQQAGGGDAVHIVIAEYGDLFSVLQCLSNPGFRQVHIGHQKGVDHLAVAIQKFFCGSGIVHTAGGQDHGGQRIKTAAGQGVYCTCFRSRYIPNSVFHTTHIHYNNIYLLLYQKEAKYTIGSFSFEMDKMQFV